MEGYICDAVLKLLRDAKARGEKLRPIAEGAGVPYSWLVRFARGDFIDAGSRRVEDVYNYLNAKRTLERQKKLAAEARA